MDASEMRRDIVDRGIERAENEMKPVLQPLAEHRRNSEGLASDPAQGRPGSNSGQMAADASDQTGTTPFNTAQGTVVSRTSRQSVSGGVGATPAAPRCSGWLPGNVTLS